MLKASCVLARRPQDGSLDGDFGKLDFVLIAGKRRRHGDRGLAGSFGRFGGDRTADNSG